MERCGLEYLEFINKILKDSSIYPLISDDFSPYPDDFTVEELIKNDKVHALCPNKYTVILFLPKNGITWEIHYNVLKQGRGYDIRKITPEILNYAFTKIPNCKKLVCYISETHKNVIDFAVSMGMKHEGRLKDSIQKNNILYDEIILGMRGKEWEQH